MPYETVNFWFEVGVIVSSVALGDVALVSIQNDVIEICNVLVEFFYGCTVQCGKMKFCFLCENCPVCSFVVCVSDRRVVGFSIRFSRDDDRQMV